jgi:leucyl aminopeptidase
MRLSTTHARITEIGCDLLVLGLAEGDADKSGEVGRLDAPMGGLLREQIGRRRFRGAEGESVLIDTHGRLPSRAVLLLGLGPKSELNEEVWRRAGGRSRALADAERAKRAAAYVPLSRASESCGEAFAEGFLLAGYRFDRYKAASDRGSGAEELILGTEDPASSRSLAGRLRAVREAVRAVFLARDLVNEPASVKTPAYLGERARSIARQAGGSFVKAEVWGRAGIERRNLRGLLAVSRGSAEPPRFIKLSYRPPGRSRTRRRIALVGKGLTFDSGGLSLKSAKAMEKMKLDVSGGAVVMAVMGAVGRLKPQVEVTAYVPATENLPGAAAQKPGDVIRYRNGKTVEVLNTDAEGRLILADALICACEEKPDAVIDVATLTGACMVALGARVAGVLGNDQRLIDDLIAHGEAAGDPLWQLPLIEDYREGLKSSVADLKNVGGPSAGAITAALFLREFVGKQRWAHLDIAGPAFTDKDLPYTPKGGTGFGVRTLLRYLTAA